MTEQLSNILTGGFFRTGLSFTGIIVIISMWCLFRKAGEKGWKSIIPFLNGHVLYRVIWKPLWFWITIILTSFIAWCAERKTTQELSLGLSFAFIVGSILLLVLCIVMAIKLARSFGRGGWFALGLILCFPLFALILALGRSKYVGPSGDERKIVVS